MAIGSIFYDYLYLSNLTWIPMVIADGNKTGISLTWQFSLPSPLLHVKLYLRKIECIRPIAKRYIFKMLLTNFDHKKYKRTRYVFL